MHCVRACGCSRPQFTAPAPSRQSTRLFAATASIGVAVAEDHAGGTANPLARSLDTAISSGTSISRCRARLNQLVDACLQHASSSNSSSAASAVEALLDSVYEHLEEIFFSKGGHVIPRAERALIDASGGSGAAAYGEVTPHGVQQLLRWLPMDGESVFADLGCGIGRMLLQVAASRPDIRGVMGIELSASRLEQAQLALQQVQEAGTPLPASVQLRLDDLSTCDLAGASHYFMCSTVFSGRMCRSLAERLATTPEFKVLVTSRPLPPQPYLRRAGSFPCSYSWNKAGRAHVYVRSFHASPDALLAQFCCADGVCWLPDNGAPAQGVVLTSAEAEEDAEHELAPFVPGLNMQWPVHRAM